MTLPAMPGMQGTDPLSGEWAERERGLGEVHAVRFLVFYNDSFVCCGGESRVARDNLELLTGLPPSRVLGLQVWTATSGLKF